MSFVFHRATARQQKFCSKACYFRTRAAKAFVPCHRCKKPVPKVTRRKFCSAECHGRRDPIPSTPTPCQQCGKVVLVDRAKREINQRVFCSYACKYKADERRMIVICRYCGAERSGPPHLLKHHEYCSSACVRKSRQETQPERHIRLALEKLGIMFIPQHTIGRYSVDFFLPLLNVALEVDGAYWHQQEKVKQRDAKRDEVLSQKGIRTVRLQFESNDSFLRLDATKLLRRSL